MMTARRAAAIPRAVSIRIPSEAVEFVRQTGLDSLAVAIGNSHGAYKFKGEQDTSILDRLKAIKKALMNAGSGRLPAGPARLLERTGKEISTWWMTSTTSWRQNGRGNGRRAGGRHRDRPPRRLHQGQYRHRSAAGDDGAAIRKVLAENPREFDPRKYLAPARARVKELVRHKVKNVLCSAGHAFD